MRTIDKRIKRVIKHTPTRSNEHIATNTKNNNEQIIWINGPYNHNFKGKGWKNFAQINFIFSGSTVIQTEFKKIWVFTTIRLIFKATTILMVFSIDMNRFVMFWLEPALFCKHWFTTKELYIFQAVLFFKKNNLFFRICLFQSESNVIKIYNFKRIHW